MVAATWKTVVILELIHASQPTLQLCLLDPEPTQAPPGHVVIHDNLTNHAALADDASFSVSNLWQ